MENISFITKKMYSSIISSKKNSENEIIKFEKTNDNIIDGCTSKAWLIISELDKNSFSIKTDSDSHIVSGLLYILALSIDKESKEFIEKVDPITILNSVGLDGHITSQRTNGFISAVETLKQRIV